MNDYVYNVDGALFSRYSLLKFSVEQQVPTIVMSIDGSIEKSTVDLFIKVCQEEECDLSSVNPYGILKLANAFKVGVILDEVDELLKGRDDLLTTLEKMMSDNLDVSSILDKIAADLLKFVTDPVHRHQLMNCEISVLCQILTHFFDSSNGQDVKLLVEFVNEYIDRRPDAAIVWSFVNFDVMSDDDIVKVMDMKIDWTKVTNHTIMPRFINMHMKHIAREEAFRAKMEETVSLMQQEKEAMFARVERIEKKYESEVALLMAEKNRLANECDALGRKVAQLEKEVAYPEHIKNNFQLVERDQYIKAEEARKEAERLQRARNWQTNRYRFVKDWGKIKAGTEVYLERESERHGGGYIGVGGGRTWSPEYRTGSICMYDQSGQLVDSQYMHHMATSDNDRVFWKVFDFDSTMVVKV